MFNVTYCSGYQPKTIRTHPSTSVSAPLFKGDNEFNGLVAKYRKHTANLASSILNATIKQGMINPHKIEHICDFGAGYGGPTQQLCDRFPDATVHALQLDDRCAKSLIDADILSRQNIFLGDGVKHLKTLDKQYDLVTAFLFGPDEEGTLAERFIEPAVQSLTPEGKVLITSDLWTMSAVSEVLVYGGYHFSWATLPLEWRFGLITGTETEPPPSGIALAVVQPEKRNAELWKKFVSGDPLPAR